MRWCAKKRRTSSTRTVGLPRVKCEVFESGRGFTGGLQGRDSCPSAAARSYWLVCELWKRSGLKKGQKWWLKGAPEGSPQLCRWRCQQHSWVASPKHRDGKWVTSRYIDLWNKKFVHTVISHGQCNECFSCVSSFPSLQALCAVFFIDFKLLPFLESREEPCPLQRVGAFLYNKQMFLTKHDSPQENLFNMFFWGGGGVFVILKQTVIITWGELDAGRVMSNRSAAELYWWLFMRRWERCQLG